MQILVVCARKGGVGKTTLAAHLAVAAMAGRRRVAVVDLDPQASLLYWHARRVEHGGHSAPRRIDATIATLPAALAAEARYGTTVTIIDTPPNVEAPVVAAAQLATHVLVPTRASSLDLMALPTTVALVRRVAAPVMHVVLNAVRARDPDVEAARAYLRRELEVTTATPAIVERAVLRRAMTDGRTALDVEPDGKAAADILALWRWLQRAYTQTHVNTDNHR